jgi:hypothetical protein
MTEQQSTLRLVLYVLIAVVSAGSAGLATIDFTDAKQVIGFGLGLLGTALTTARSYIDTSEKQIYRDEEGQP